MLEVNPLKVQLRLFQRRYNLKITNPSDAPIIFKIRSTNPSAFSIQPNAGFLRAKTQLSVLITVKSRKPFEQRIDISYCTVSKSTPSFEQTWHELKAKGFPFDRIIVPIILQAEQEQEELGQSSISASRISRASKIGSKAAAGRISQVKKREGLAVIREEEELRNMIQQGKGKKIDQKELILQHYQRQKRRFEDEEERQQLLFKLQQLSNQCQEQATRCQRLKQQLQIAENKLRQNSRLRVRNRFGQTINAVCHEHHTSFTSLALIILLSSLMGYTLALLQ